VVGTVTIISISPKSENIGGRTKNGSMINPSPANDNQGYDNSMTSVTYSASLNKALNVSASSPLVLANSSLVSTISIDAAEQRDQLKDAAILTVLSSAPAVGSFRPSYSGTDKTVKFNVNNLDYTKLGTLAPTASTPRIKQQTGDTQSDSVERMFERPWIEHRGGWGGEQVHPTDNMPNYGREVSDQIGTGALALQLDYSSKSDFSSYGSNNAYKKTLMIRFTQVGIDLYGIIANGGANNWGADGGHDIGRKWPILFAGIVLNDNNMKTIGTTTAFPSTYGVHPAFGEDQQTFYVSQSDVNITNTFKGDSYHRCDLYGHYDIECKKQQDYLLSDIGLPEWGITHLADPVLDDKNWVSDTKSGYRQCCTAISWAGWVLATHIMSAKNLWNHDALFDYQDRYMEVEKILNDGSRSWNTFTEEMWDKYRTQYGCVWTPTNPNDPYSNGSNSCIGTVMPPPVTQCFNTTSSCGISQPNCAICSANQTCTNNSCQNIQTQCTENWSCGSSWSTCTNNQQSRTCTDSNNCGTVVSKPATAQSCTITPPPSSSSIPSDYISYWKFNGNANDEKNANNGIVSGNAQFAIDVTRGQVLSFDGSSGAVSLGSQDNLDNMNNFTVSAWVNIKGMPKNGLGRIFVKEVSGNDTDGVILQFNFGYGYHNAVFQAYAPYTTNAVAVSQNLYPNYTNNWYHIAMVFDATTKNIALYINGNEANYQSRTTASGNRNNDASGGVFIGDSSYGSRTFNGFIDDVVVYGRALSQSEIQAIYSSQIALNNNQSIFNVASSISAIGEAVKRLQGLMGR
jgi:hypothetical protein